MSRCRLTIVATVKPPSAPEVIQTSQAHLDRIEADRQHRLRCIDEDGGMNIIDENEREKKKSGLENFTYLGVLVPILFISIPEHTKPS
jgi:hypothetical protein